MTLVDAVYKRDIEAVRTLLASGADTELRSRTGSTPLMLAAASDQFVIAELLIDRGADVFAFDSLGVTVGGFVESSRLHPDRPEGAARLRVLEKMKVLGFPFPAPRSKEVLARVAAGAWPPRKP